MFPHEAAVKKECAGNSLVIQGLRLCDFTDEGLGSIFVQGTKIHNNPFTVPGKVCLGQY